MSKYSQELKLKVVKSYLEGVLPSHLSSKYGMHHRQITKWVDYYRQHGLNAFEPKYIQRTPKEKLDIIKHMRSNFWSASQTCVYYNIPSESTLLNWIKNYEQEGLAGLKSRPKGRPKLMKPEVKKLKPINKMNVSELRKELELRRAEVAIAKKLDALMQLKKSQTEKK